MALGMQMPGPVLAGFFGAVRTGLARRPSRLAGAVPFVSVDAGARRLASRKQRPQRARDEIANLFGEPRRQRRPSDERFVPGLDGRRAIHDALQIGLADVGVAIA